MTKMLEISSFYMCPKITIIWYGVEPTEFLVILGHFLSFSPPINPENQNFGKMKNAPDVNILHMHTPKTTFIWCMLPEIQGVTHRILHDLYMDQMCGSQIDWDLIVPLLRGSHKFYWRLFFWIFFQIWVIGKLVGNY